MEFDNCVFLGDCYEVLQSFPSSSRDACVSDVPYGLGDHEPTPEEILTYLQGGSLNTGGDFQNHDWEIPSIPIWKEVFRVLKPGGHLTIFGGTKTFDLISLGLRMAGFERRDTIANNHPGLIWCQSQGMPKSRDPLKTDITPKVEKLLRQQGIEGPIVWGTVEELFLVYEISLFDIPFEIYCDRKGTFQLSKKLEGLRGMGTGLKPTWEPILVFRKPLACALANNVLLYGTGVFNIDAARVKHANQEDFEEHKKQVELVKAKGGTRGNSWKNSSDLSGANDVKEAGRWPTNVTFTHSPECRHVGTVKVKAPVINRFDDGAKVFGGGAGHPYTQHQMGDENGEEDIAVWDCSEGCPVRELNLQKGPVKSGEAGKVSKFFPQFEGQAPVEIPFFYTGKASAKESTLDGRIENKHPTRKPLALMRWLVKLVTPSGGSVLDPYCGSGTTLHAAILEGMTFTGIEIDPEFHGISSDRSRMVLEDLSETRDRKEDFEGFLED
jgi:DNA modification methylase